MRAAMLVSRHQPARSFLPSLFCLHLALAICSSALHVTPNSKCSAACDSGSDITTPDDIVCYDEEFSGTTNGSRYRECVQCELGSTDVDNSNGMTDVLWGIYNLRYAVSTCVYGYPVEKAALSTPCQVSCESLEPALEMGIGNGTEPTSTDLAFCNNRAWAEVVINKCVYCYNWTSTERYLSNFLQSLHNACRVPPASGSIFPIDPTLIFSSAQVSAPPSASATPVKHSNPNLSLIIALPTVFGALILLTTIVCCGFCARRRRRRMAASGNMDRVHQGSWGDPNIASIYGPSYFSPHGRVPAWSQHSPGFASQRNSGMGWAQQLTSFAGFNKRSSRGSSNSGAPYYEGWGNTFAPGSPRDWANGTELHERYFPASTINSTTKSTKTAESTVPSDKKMPLSPPPQLESQYPPDIKQPIATTTGHQRRTSFSRPFNGTNFPPPPSSQPPNSHPASNQPRGTTPPDLNLKIPPQPAIRTQNSNGTSVVSPDDYPHFSSSGGYSSEITDPKFPTPYHDLSSPESASTDRGAMRGQSFVFDEGRKRWVKD